MLGAMTRPMRHLSLRLSSPWRRALWLALAVYVLYLLAANVFLNTALGERTINRKPERFQAQWAWVMSLYPGHIHASGVAMGGRASAAAWHVQATSAHGRIMLLPLLRRELRFGRIRADDVVLVTDRGRRDPAPVATASAGRRTPWTLRFDGIETDTLVRLQFDRWRFEGGGEARFGMVKMLGGGTLEVFPSQLRMPSATIRHGDRTVLRAGRIALDFTLPPHTPAAVRGRRKVAIADARLSMHGQVPGAVIVEDGDGRLSWRFDGAPGRLDAELTLREGALAPGSRLRVLAPLHVEAQGQRDRRYRLRVAADVARNGITLRASMPAQAGRPDRLEATLRSGRRQIDLTRLRAFLDDLSGRVELQWRFGSLRWINPLLSDRRWLQLDGEADLAADLRLVDGALATGSTAQVRDAELRVEVLDSVFVGQARVDARVVDPQRLRMAIVAETFNIAAKDTAQQAYVRGRDLRLDLDGSAELAAFRRTLHADLRFADAVIPDLRAYNRYLPGDSLQLLGGSGRVSGEMDVDAAGEVERAQLQLRGQRADIRFGVSRLVGDLRLDSRLHRIAPGARDYRLDRLDLSLDDVRLAGDGAAPWWARLDLGGARLDWRPPFGLDGEAKLRMKDASLLLSLFAELSAFPRWIGRIVDEGEVQATARVHVAGDVLVLDAIDASNDRVDLQARLRVAGGRPQGDLYARWGVLGIGAELQAGKRKLHAVGARKWYESQPSLLPPSK